MKHRNLYVKRYAYSAFEWILLSQILQLPEWLSEHPKFIEATVIFNPNTSRKRLVKKKLKKVYHYCSIEINDIISTSKINELITNNPFFLDYSYPLIKRELDMKKEILKMTRLFFWIPTEGQQEEY